MQDKASPCSPEHEDRLLQQGVMSFVLTEHPTLLSVCEIVRETSGDNRLTGEQAIRDLVGAGLLRREGATVLPTRAALHFDAFENE